ncbi:MAG: DUF1572 family protein [Candidatus Zixiibacteriota bacterium]|nr:MAG: DUF1572 family protein [candidate division Zixibacteria bacterium]
MISEDYLKDSISQFRKHKKLVEKALSQVSDRDFFREPGPESNSIAIMIKHMAGNMRSRWRDFLISNGEKTDRHRDTEFEIEPDDSRKTIMIRWERGWKFLFDSIEPLKPEDLEKKITIRGEPHTVVEAINRQINHNAYHIGQIVYLARHYAGEKWETLSVPKGKSEELTKKMREKFK